MENKTKKLINSFKYAGEGIISAFHTERNMKIHIFIMIFTIIMGIFLDISPIEWCICVLLFGGVIAGELFNTVIEVVVDMIITEIHPKAKLAKDLSAGAVLVWALCAIIIGGIIFIPKILNLF